MVKFEPPLFIKAPDPKDVIVFGKDPKLQVQDSERGISRFGGVWRSPCYLFSYLRSAAILVDHGVERGTLDDIGLPAFYMQRHATELLIKRLLSWLYGIAQLISEFGKPCPDAPSSGQLDRFKRSHNLYQLFNNLCLVSKHFGFDEPPIELHELIHKMALFEKSDSWARYERSHAKSGAVIHHVQDEVALPLVDLQRCLELAISKTIHQLAGEKTYEMKLYDEWLDTARAAGRAG